MNERTKVALLGSIAKWGGIVAGTMEDKGVKNCPLCVEFHKKRCRGCPVAEKMEDAYCRNTPYERYARIADPNSPAALESAKEELAFLRSLLPVEQT